MFLKLSREDFSWSRSKKALPVFLLLWAGGLVLAFSYLISVRVHLQAIERDQTEKLLDSYLATHRTLNRFFAFGEQQQGGNLLQGLAFLRITQGRDQMVVLGSQGRGLDFKRLMNLPPDSSGVWLPVGVGRDKRLLTVIIRSYEDGVVVQAGKDGREGYQLFNQLVRYTVFILFSSVIMLWPLSIFFIRLSLNPLIATGERISDLVSHASGLLPEKGNGPELDRLYGQINQLIRRNRHLVAEMQQSLDNVAHDLRTPMTRLRSVAEYGLQAREDSERLREALSDCLEESDRVLAMLRIMMSVAEAESGTMRLEIKQCDLVPTLEQAITLYEYVAEEQKVHVQLEADSPLFAFVDPTRISQVWANLLDNGIKYGREGGWVRISAEKHGKEVVVSFTDNGMGISESERDRIWERLYRGDRSRSRKGLGLGLNYVQAVVAAHRGRVLVKSRLHQGSQFEVRLPVGPLSTQEKSQISGEWSESRTSGI